MKIEYHRKFGRIKQRTRAANRQIIFSFIFIAFISFFFAFATSISSSATQVNYGISIILCILGFAIIVIGFLSLKSGMAVYEKGVELTSLRGGRDIPFSQIKSLSFSSTEVFVNGVYNHTKATINLTLRNAPAAKLSQQVVRDDKTFYLVRDIISEIIADQMAEVLEKIKKVQWVSGVSITSSSLVIDGRFSRGVPMLRNIPLASIEALTFRDGECIILERGSKDPVLSIDVSSENFWPGLALVNRAIHL